MYTSIHTSTSSLELSYCTAESVNVFTSAMEENDEPKNQIKICCCSKSILEKANRIVVLKTVFPDDELGERLKKRFEEIFVSAVHQNVSIDHKTWSEVAEEGNSTIDFDPVDLSLKELMDQKILGLDEMIVETGGKRKAIPPQTSRQLAKWLKVKRKSSVLSVQTSQSKPAFSQRLPMNDTEIERIKEGLHTSCTGFNSCSKSLPEHEDKATRLKEAMASSSRMASSHTYRVLQKPHPDEAVLAKSLTPLKRRLEETPESKALENKDVLEKIRRGHPIKQYHFRSTTTTAVTESGVDQPQD